jgi:hypothetical protein
MPALHLRNSGHPMAAADVAIGGVRSHEGTGFDGTKYRPRQWASFGSLPVLRRGQGVQVDAQPRLG